MCAKHDKKVLSNNKRKALQEEINSEKVMPTKGIDHAQKGKKIEKMETRSRKSGTA